MHNPKLKILFIFLHFAFSLAELPGTWDLLLQNAGISSMHTAVSRFNTVILLDRTHIGPSQLPIPCSNPDSDCTAHSALFDPSSLSLRPLSILTDTWCSSAQFLPNGTLLQTGGDFDGLRQIRSFSPCPPNLLCDWLELPSPLLSSPRWYATNQILPDGSIIIVGGRNSPSVEFFPPSRPFNPFPFLDQVSDSQFDNLYPFVHLLPDGHLFIFANRLAVLYDYESAEILREYPPIPGGPRTYPSAGSSVMLALSPVFGGYFNPEILICGGAEFGAFLHREIDAKADSSCGRIGLNEPNPVWVMEDMPFPRIMGDMVMLPTGDVLIINGAMAGSQGFEMASKPCLNPVLYRPNEPVGLRFMTLNPTTIPRMYHSTANLLPDGRVLVAGSNPHYFYRFDEEFPTELRIEAFSPEYLGEDRGNLRPEIVVGVEKVGYGEMFVVGFSVELPLVGIVEVNLASAPFSTHSFSQGQRLVKLVVSPAAEKWFDGGRHFYEAWCRMPLDGRVAPPGYYMVFAVNEGVPSVAKWVQLL